MNTKKKTQLLEKEPKKSLYWRLRSLQNITHKLGKLYQQKPVTWAKKKAKASSYIRRRGRSKSYSLALVVHFNCSPRIKIGIFIKMTATRSLDIQHQRIHLPRLEAIDPWRPGRIQHGATQRLLLSNNF